MNSFLFRMASVKNDRLGYRTQLGQVNYYDNQSCIGTSTEKAHAARLGGHNYNPISNEPYTILTHLRNREHYIEESGAINSMLIVFTQ